MIHIIDTKYRNRSLLSTALTLLMMVWFAPEVTAQTPSPPPLSDGTAEINASTQPRFENYRGVRIGMSAEDVRQKLGTPDVKDQEQDLFLFSNGEIAQVVYDKGSKVSAISITYSGKNDEAPTASFVLGEEVLPGADGSMYKLVRYPAAGYWVAYSRTAGDPPVVSITMQGISE